ncbi:MAG: hypothetical protein AAFY08_12050 [Planctomycetota bacterium]
MKNLIAMAVVASFVSVPALAGGYYQPKPVDDDCFTFDLRGHGGKKRSYTIEAEEGDKFVTVTAKSEDYHGNLVSAKVDQTGSGMGVKHDYYDGSSQVDGHGYDDILFFDFGKEVKIGKIKFSHVDYNDDATFVDYENMVIYADGVKLEDIDIDFWGVIDLSVYDLKIDKLGIKADGKYDDFRVKSIEVCHCPKVVPTPTAAGLGLLGVMGLVARRRRT